MYCLGFYGTALPYFRRVPPNRIGSAKQLGQAPLSECRSPRCTLHPAAKGRRVGAQPLCTGGVHDNPQNSFKLSRAPCVNTAQDTFNSPQNTLGHRCDPNRESAQLRTRSRECGKDFVSEVRRGGLWTLCRNLRRLHMHLLKAAIVLLIAACSQSQ